MISRFKIFSLAFLLLNIGANKLFGYTIDSTELDGKLIGKNLLFYEDKLGNLTIENLAKMSDESFTKVDKNVPNFGSTTSVYWARLDLDSVLKSDIELIIEYLYPLADYVEFYTRQLEGPWERLDAGDRRMSNVMGYHHRLPMKAIMLSDKPQTIFIRVQNEGFTQFPVKLWTKEKFHDNRLFETMALFSMLLVMGVMLVYNLLTYIMNRDSVMGLYLVFLFFNILTQLAPNGLLRLIGYGEFSAFLSNKGYLLNTGISVILSCFISMRFLEISSAEKKTRYIFYFGIFSAFLSAIISALSYGLGAKFITITGFVVLPIILILSVQRTLRGSRPAFFFTIAWTAPIVGVIIQQMYYWNIIVSNPYFSFGGLFGTSCEAILISLAIGDKIRNQIQTVLATNQRMNIELLDKDKARTVFFQNTSHELRTPLNGMIGFLDLLIKGNYGALSETVNQQLQKTLRLAESLKSQVNTILDLARVKRGEVGLRCSLISLTDLKKSLDDLAEGLKIKHPNSQFTSELIIEHSTGTLIQDHEKIFAICKNLLGNAFKFSRIDATNSIKLTLKRLDKDFIIQVSDSGIGIPADQKNRIFDEFAQIQSDERRIFEGTGLGLSIVRDFVKLMDGTIEVHSELGKGSIFTIRVPEQPAVNAEVSPDFVKSIAESSKLPLPIAQTLQLKHSQPSGEAASFSILVVDDNEINCEVIEHILAGKGYSVTVCLSGRRALELARAESFDIVLLDVMMPEMSGEDVLKTMRSDIDLREIPVILITARASDEDRIHGLNLGADDYISKPIIADELLLRVGNLLTRLSETKQTTRQESDEKIRQVADIFAYVSHEIKNIYQGFEDDNIEQMAKEFQAIARLISLTEQDIQHMAKAVASPQSARSLQESLDKLPKVPKDQATLRALRTDLACFDIPPEHLPGIWQHITKLSEKEQDTLRVLLQLSLRHKQTWSSLVRSRDIFFSALGFIRDDSSEHCQLWDALDPIIVLMAVRARKENVRFEADIKRIAVLASSMSLQQIVLNLISNAFDAVQSLPAEEKYVRVWVDESAHGHSVQLRVLNGGARIADEFAAHLFKRGFTTKGNRGHGLGLYFSKKLAHRIHGNLTLDATNQKTCFILEIEPAHQTSDADVSRKIA